VKPRNLQGREFIVGATEFTDDKFQFFRTSRLSDVFCPREWARGEALLGERTEMAKNMGEDCKSEPLNRCYVVSLQGERGSEATDSM